MAHPAVTAFVRALDQFDRSKTRTEIFRLFCEMAYCALAKRASPFADQQDRLEAEYMDCVGRFPNKDDIRRMPEMMAIAIEAIAGGGLDFFGQVAAEIGALDAGLGQFFTPYEISRLMAEMSLGDAPAQIEAQGFITVSEPAAGAGGMVLALADALESQGFDPARHRADNDFLKSAPSGAECREKSIGGLSPAGNPDDLSWLTPEKIRSIAGQNFRFCLDAICPVGEQMTDRHLRSVAIMLLPDLGINASAWEEALQVFGSMRAALAVLIIDANRNHPTHPIHSPGGALRAFTRLQLAGQFNLSGSLIGLVERSRAEP